MKFIITFLMGMLIIVGCGSNVQLEKKEARMRKIDKWEGQNFHREIAMKVAWIPYNEGTMTETKDNQWSLSFPDSNAAEGMLPVMILSYPDSNHFVMIDLHMDNALLGNLIKHTLMTEAPIERPFMEYLKTSDCSKCHPPDIQLN